MTSQAQAAYRVLLRELRKSSIFPRAERGTFVSKQILAIAHSARQTPEIFRRHVLNAAAFLKAQREYKILMDRYNPLHGLSVEEQRKATAHRVGLELPKEFKE
ncbi:complex 1 LYR-like protein [Rhizoctonia solani 123E]|uniref:Complex 1 LYR-like protein n=1 Tax=Rhizoctonia solani 123E TaxID=1423351 RepID=A0A074SC40_9AGAM|nr:complex 1 LYR-like protein [Rhizoctonia solani 123E]